MSLIVAVLAVMGTIGYVTVSDVTGGAKQTKLLSDVKALNTAVLGYIASNGDLSTANNAADVVSQLKTTNSDARFNGLRGGFLDGRIDLEMQSEEEAASDSLRVYWDSDAMKFIVGNSGPPGIKGFALLETESIPENSTEDRASLMSLAAEDEWIWDYVEATPAVLPGPSTLPTVDEPATSPAPVPIASASVPVPVLPLIDPVFSIPPNSYSITNFDLNVSIVNANPPGSSEIYFRVGYGNWDRYGGGSILVTPGASIQAQAIPVDASTHESSSVVGGAYEATPIQLIAPMISPDVSEFSVFGEVDIQVTLNDVNALGTSSLEYRIEGGPWMDHTGPFTLPAMSYPGGATIEARAISSGSPYYLTSSISSLFIPIEEIVLSGNTVGEFSNPTGESGMQTNIAPGGSDSYFEWGDASGNGYSESWMEFYGGSFNDIIDGQQFNVGSLSYYNGTILGGSGADTVDLQIALDLDLNGRTFRPYFDFTFELINTPNSSDEITSADYVYLDDARSSRTIVFDGYEFEFELEFGETTEDGFSQFDRFNVIENRDSAVNLYGRFNLLGPAGGSVSDGGSSSGGVIIDDDPTTGLAGNVLYQKEGYQDQEEQLDSVFPVVEALAVEAQEARNLAVGFENSANLEYQNFLTLLSSNNISGAYSSYLTTAGYATSAEAETAKAEDAADEAAPYAVQAKNLALSDPRAADEAIQVTDEVNAAAQFATQAEAAAVAARQYADKAQTAYVLATTPSNDDDDDD